MAIDMQERIAHAIKRAAAADGSINELLFTGHSAGGAVAQILFALSMVEGSLMNEFASGKSPSEMRCGCPDCR